MQLHDIQTILAAHAKQRDIQQRVKPTADEPNPKWYDVLKNFVDFDFHRHEYRIAPVVREVWMVYDAEHDQYIADWFDNPCTASARAQWLNDHHQSTHFTMIKLVPADVQA